VTFKANLLHTHTTPLLLITVPVILVDVFH